MNLTTLLLLALALGTDAFSLSIGIGMSGITIKQSVLMSATILVFHIFMPLTGYIAGEVFGTLMGKVATVIGACILIYLGLKMVIDLLKDKKEKNTAFIVANFWGLFLLAGSVSMDALSVGFSLGTRKVALGLAVLIFGVVAGLMTFTGLEFGKKIGNWIGEKSTLLGGFILVAIGVKLFF